MEDEVAPGLRPRMSGMGDVTAPGPMEFFRAREQDETELVQWPLLARKDGSDAAPAAPALCEPRCVRLQSKNSQREAYVLFANASPHTIRLLWLDYMGHEVAYDMLEPGESFVQHTFVTHPWICREATTGTQLLLNGASVFVPHPMLEPPRQQALAPAPAPAGGQHSAAQAEPGGPQQAQQQAQPPPEAQQQHTQQPAQQQAQQQAQPQPQEERSIRVYGPLGPRFVRWSALQRVEITGLPRLAWSPAAHAFFPRSFQAAARAFLLCYQRLNARVAGAQQPPALAPGAGPRTGGPALELEGPSLSPHLGHLPHLLLPSVVAAAAPDAWQGLELPLGLRPGIAPALLPEAPPTPEECAAIEEVLMQQEAWLAAEEALDEDEEGGEFGSEDLEPLEQDEAGGPPGGGQADVEMADADGGAGPGAAGHA